MLTKRVQDALNQQLNLEFNSSYSYLAMAAYADVKNLKGIAHWLQLQAEEERGHAMRFYNFILQRNGRVELLPITSQPAEWPNLKALFEDALAQETRVTESINALVNLSLEERDHATHSFLQWFVNEQVEELALVEEVLGNIQLVDGNGGALFILDRELGQRPAEEGGEAEG